MAFLGHRFVFSNRQQKLITRFLAALREPLGEGAVELVLNVRNYQPYQR
jgi:hypothetical protein